MNCKSSSLRLPALFFLFLLSSISSQASTYYWVGGTGNWSDYKNHWATSSGGSSFHKLVPTSLDDVIFDASSFSSTGAKVTLDSIAYCRSLDWKNVSNAPAFVLTKEISIYGSISLSSSMSLSGKGSIYFQSSATGNSILTKGRTMPSSIIFNGTGSWDLADSLTISATNNNKIFLQSGSFNTKGYTVRAGELRVDGTLKRSLKLSTSRLYLIRFVDSISTNFSLYADTSTIELSSIKSFLYTAISLTFNNVIFSNSSSTYGNSYIDAASGAKFNILTFKGDGALDGGITIDTLVLSGGKAFYPGYYTHNITGTIITNGSCSSFTKIYGTSTFKKTSGTITLDWALLLGITGTGGATFIANNSLDRGNNTGWKINAPAHRTFYWIGNSGNWDNASHWSLSSGGSSSGCYPTDSDDVVFDANSFTSTGQSVSLNNFPYFRNMDWSKVKNNPALSFSSNVTCFGSISLSGNMTLIGSSNLTFAASSKGNTIRMAGNTFSCQVLFYGKGEWTLLDSFQVATGRQLHFYSGTVNTNSNYVSAYYVFITPDGTINLNLGSSIIDCYSFDEITNSGNTYKVNAGTSQINLNGNSSSFRTLTAATYYNLTFDPGTGSSTLDNSSAASFHKVIFIGSGILIGTKTMDTLSLAGGSTYIFNSSGIYYIKNAFIANGSCTSLITLTNNSGSGQATISKSSGTVLVTYVKMSNMKGTGGATFKANNSQDLGNNSGWTISKTTPTDFYWIGNSGSWSSGSHWSATSGGPAVGCTPSDSDDVIFDSKSFSSSGKSVTIDVPAYCRNMDWTAATNKPTLGSDDVLTLHGSLELISNMSVLGTKGISFASSNPSNTINTASKTLNSITFSGSGKWTMKSPLLACSSCGITFNGGTFNSKSYKISARSMTLSPGAKTTLNLDSSKIYLNNLYEYSSSYVLSFNAGYSTFYCDNFDLSSNLKFYNYIAGNTAAGNFWGQYGSSITFNKLAFKMDASVNIGAATVDTITFNAGNNYDLETSTASGFTIKSQFIGNGTACNYTTFSGGFTFTKTKDSIKLNYANLQQAKGTGGAKFIATNTYDRGSNTGWTITGPTPRNFYWIKGSGNWNSTTNWSFSSGGVSCGCYPLDSDNVIFDSYSFTSAGQALTLTTTKFRNPACRNMDWTGAKYNPSIYAAYAFADRLTINGNLKFISGMTVRDGIYVFSGAGKFNTINSAGKKFPYEVCFNGSGEWTLTSDLFVNTNLNLENGTLNSNHYAITAEKMATDYITAKPVLNLGNSKVYLRYFSDSFNTGIALHADSSTFTFTKSNSRLYSTFAHTYYNVFFTDNFGTGVYLDGTGKQTFNKLNFSGNAKILNTTASDSLVLAPGNSYYFAYGKTQTVNKYIFANGSYSGLTFLQSTVAGKRATISKPSGSVCLELAYIKDIAATGGASWTAGNNCIDLGNNTGWAFSFGFSCLPRTITTGVVNGSPFCAGTQLKVPYTITGNYNPTNKFAVLLSDSTGNFTNADTIGFKATNLADTVLATIPYTIKYGTGYRVRVVSKGPIVVGSINSTDLTILPSPLAFTGNDTAICKGKTISLGASAVTGNTYAWSSSPAGLTSTASGISVTPSSTISYSLTETITATGCSRTNTSKVTVNPLPAPNAGSNKIICTTTSTSIGTTASTGNSYSWTSSPTGFTSTLSNPTVSPAVNTIYFLTQTIIATGCSNVDSALISLTGPPTPKAGKPAAICKGQAASIGDTAVSGHTYSWTSKPAGFTSTLAMTNVAPKLNTIYYLTTSIGTCSRNDSVEIVVNPLPVASAGSSKTICAGQPASIGNTSVSGNTYSWISHPTGFTSTTANPSVTPSITTNYFVKETITATGCSKIDSVLITVNQLPNAVVIKDTAICSGQSLSLGGTAISGNTYTWTSVPSGYTSSLANPTVSPAGTLTYYLTETNSSTTCSKSDSVKVTVNPLPLANAGTPSISCAGQTVSIGGTSVTGNTYSWTSAPAGFTSTLSNPTVKPTSTTTYNLTEAITATGCTKSNSVKITVNSLPLAKTGGNKNICSGQSLTLGVASLSGHTYAWTSNPAGFTSTLSNPSVTPSATTKYYLTEVITASGCSFSDSAIITVNPLPLAKTGGNQTICSGQSIQIGAVAVAGNKYAWTSLPSVFTSTISNPTVSPTTTTTYYLTETISTTTCQASDSLVVTVNPLPAAKTGGDRAICFGQSTILGNTAISGNTYSWTSKPGGFTSTLSNPSVSPLVTTTYHLTESVSATTCQKTDSLEVTVNPLPAANTGPDHAICPGQITSIGAIAISGHTYSWTSIPVGFTSSLSKPNVGPASTTIFYLKETITATGCTQTDSVIITVNPLPSAKAGANRAICLGQSTQIGDSAIAGNSYIWTSNPPAGGFSSTLSNPVVTPTSTTTYYLTESIASTACSKSDSVNVTVNPLPAASTGPAKTICLNQSTQIGSTAVSGNTYSWTSVPAGFTSTLSNPIVIPSITTVYFLTETVTSTSCQKTDSVKVIVNPLPAANKGRDTAVCFGQTATLGSIAVSGNTYSWTSIPAGFSSTYSNPTVNPIVTTRYFLTEKISITGCNKTDSVNVIVNPLPSAKAGSSQNICLSQTASIGDSAVTGNSYNWSSNPSGYTSTLSHNLVSPLVNTTYYLKETILATGCSKSDSVQVLLYPKFAVNTGGNKNICFGQTQQLGLPPLSGNTYSWLSDPVGFLDTIANPLVKPLVTTTYVLTQLVTGTGCQRTDSILVKVNPLPLAITARDTALCAGQGTNIGGPSVTGNTYAWTSNPTTTGFATSISNPFISPSVSATYYLLETITATSCKATDSIKVIVNPLPAANAGISKALCLGENDTIGDKAVSGNIYSWTSSPTGFSSTVSNPVISPVGTATYYLTKTISATSCSKSDSITIIVNPLPSASTGPAQTLCAGDSVSIGGVSISGNYYTWTSKPAGYTTTLSNPKISPASTTWFYLTETKNATSCRKMDSVLVTVNPRPKPVISGANQVCAYSSLPYYTKINPGSTYKWTVVGDSSFWISTNSDSVHIYWGKATTGIVKVLETNSFGCSDSDIITVNIHPNPTPSIKGPDTICAKQTTTYSTKSIPNHIYLWKVDSGSIVSGQNTNSITVHWPQAPFGFVQLYESDTFGCGTLWGKYITIQSLPTPSITGRTSVCANTSASYLTTKNVGSAYVWKQSGGVFTYGSGTDSMVIKWLNAGPATLKIIETNANGCIDSAFGSITIHNNPTPKISGSKSICTGFSAPYKVPATTGSSYNWTVSNGNLSSGQGTDSIYVAWPTSGSGLVKVSEKDINGCSGLDSVIITINALPKPVISGALKVCAKSVASYQTPKNTGSTYAWKIKGGNILSGSGTDSIRVQWSGAGSATLDVIETNAAGCIDSASTNITIDPLPTPKVSGILSVCAKSSASYYTAGVSGNTYKWTFSGGTLNSGAGTDSINLSWPNAGIFSVQVLETSSIGCADSSTIAVNVHALPVPKISGPANVCATSIASYTTPKNAGNTYNWKVTGGTVISGASRDSLTTSWPTAGSGNLIVKETDGFACIDSASLSITIDALPKPAISGSTKICQGSLTAYKTPASTGSKYNWSSSLGSITSGAGTDSININWSAFGLAKVKLIETNAAGCSDSAFLPVTINIKPVASISGLSKICNRSLSTYKAGKDSISSYTWSFRNDILTSGKNLDSLSIAWNKTGSDSVFLKLTNKYGCADSSYFGVNIMALPNPTIKGLTGICEGVSTSYLADSTSGNTYNWKISGGTISSGAATDSISVSFAKSGPALLALKITNAAACADSSSMPITVNPRPKPFITGTQTLCNLSSASYSTPSATGDNFNWKVTGGSIIIGNGTDSITALWLNAGTNKVSVIETTKLGCSDSTETMVNVNPKPWAGFSFSKTCFGNPTSFTDTSKAFTSETWAFGDGFTSNSQNPTHTYTMAGAFNASHMVKNGFGCTDSVSVPVKIDVKPEARFSVNPVCIGKNSEPMDSSLNTTNWSWSFDDGGTASIQKPVHYFKVSGARTITLVASNATGCSDTMIQTAIIYKRPNAQWMVSKLPGNDYHFQASDTTHISYAWSFGDGVNGQGRVIQHTYGQTEVFTTRLRVTSLEGCLADFDSDINVIDEHNLRLKAYPNPFVDHTTISYTLQNPANVAIGIYTIRGKQVAMLADESQDAGVHIFELDANRFGLSQATYLMKIIVNGEVSAIKLIRAR